MYRKSFRNYATKIVAGEIYAETYTYGLVDGDDTFELLSLNCVEILSREGDKAKVRVHLNYHPSVGGNDKYEIEADVLMSKFGVEYVSFESFVFLPTVLITREYMEECEARLNQYHKEWNIRKASRNTKGLIA